MPTSPAPATPPPTIFDPLPTARPQGLPPIAQVAAAEAVRLIADVQGFESEITARLTALYQRFWSPTLKGKGADGTEAPLTTEALCGAIGPRAVSLFTATGTLSAALNAIRPGSVPESIPAGRVATPHADGTVTISGAPAPAPAA